MSHGAFKKVLEKLAGEGYNLNNPIDLKTFWAKHGTNKFVTISSNQCANVAFSLTPTNRIFVSTFSNRLASSGPKHPSFYPMAGLLEKIDHMCKAKEIMQAVQIPSPTFLP
uniref:GAGA-binding transcriptional activator n=1 Tax=Oryza meridionalis TaxID=40149 RepID=A0A0E0EVC0_9ORYZ